MRRKGEFMKKNKSGAKRVCAYVGGAVVLCLLLVVLLANCSQSAALAMEKIPVIGPIAEVVTFRTYEDQTNQFSAHIEVPEVQPQQGSPEYDGEGGAAAEQADAGETSDSSAEDAQTRQGLLETNEAIQEYADGLIEMYERDLEATQGEGKYSLESTYRIVTDTEEYLAIEIDTLLVMAGGTEYRKTFNVDKNTGELLSLGDFFEEGSDYIALISDEIKAQMQEQMDADENVYYWLDSEVPEWNFTQIDEETAFYFDQDGNLIIQFDEYEVAPGYMGAVSFTIPEQKLSDIRKD